MLGLNGPLTKQEKIPMSVVLMIFGVIAGFISILTFMTASAMPSQLLAGEFGIAAAVLFSAAAIVDAVDKLRNGLVPKKPPIPGPGGL